MTESNFRDELQSQLTAIRSLLDRAVELQETGTELERGIHDLEQQRTVTSTGLLEYAATSDTYNRHQTEMAQERTDLTREQTRLSTRSTELATIRTDLSRERSSLAGQRTDLSVLRTDMARGRTNLAGQRTEMAQTRTGLSEKRTELAEGRTKLAGSRTVLSRMRTELARGRTYLALTRTGLAFLTLGIGLFRFFGVSWWSLFDGGLVLASAVITAVGLRGYLRATRATEGLEANLEPVS
jgi:uncharacterized membrane protein YidH (DUF202 family)